MRRASYYRSSTSWGDRILFGVVGLVVAAVVGLLGYMIWFWVNDPGHGTITGKSYHAAWISCGGKPIICTTHPECYEVDYNDGHHDGSRCLSQGEYNSYKVGDYYPRGAS